MKEILNILKSIPEYRTLLQCLEASSAVALTGIGQINRSHILSGLYTHTDQPLVIICQDDMAAKRLQGELTAFTGEDFPILPGRELTLYDSIVVSRGWEQRRLRQLYDLSCSRTRVQIMSWESLAIRTMPPTLLHKTVFRLTVGKSYDLEDLVSHLTDAGYSRASMVEGPGQFAVRGGILDVFSPAADRPFRAEFFGDELDTMGYFDPDTQRRTENTDEVVLLPISETLPSLHPQGIEGLCDDISQFIARQRRRKTPNEVLISTLEKDLETFRNRVQNAASDRYMALIYPDFACAVDYIPKNASVVLCDHGNLHRAARSFEDEMGLALDGLLQSGAVAGELCDYTCPWERFCQSLQQKATVYLDAFAGAA